MRKGLPGAVFRLSFAMTVLWPTIGGSQIADPYWEAMRFFELGRYRQASQKLELILRRDAECIDCYDLLGQIAAAEGNDSLAVEWYRRAIEIEPENSSFLQKLGLAEHRAGQLEDAITNLKHSLQLNPTNGESHFALGNIWFELGAKDSAKTEYHLAIDIDSSIAKYHFQLGLVYLQGEPPDSSTALTEFRRTYALYPKSTQAYQRAADILIKQERMAEAAEVLEAALASATETILTRYWLGAAHVAIGNYKRAADILGGFVMKNPEHLGARYQYGLALYEIGEFEQSVENLTPVSEKMRDITKAQLFLGSALSRLNQDSLAMVVFDSLLVKEPRYYEVWIERGDVYLKQRDYAAAGAQYMQASRINAQLWQSFHRQGMVHYYQGRYEQAELLLYAALARNDSITMIYNALGDVSAAMGEDDFSVYFYFRVLQSEPENIAVREKLINALIRSRLWSYAAGQLLWFVDKNPDDESKLYRLVLVAEARGDTARVREYSARFEQLHTMRREKEMLELRVTHDSRNPIHYKAMGLYFREKGDGMKASEYFRRAVVLGDTTISVSDYMEEGVGP